VDVPIPIVIDTDGGVDDAAALWWALRSPRLEVIAITVVHGNLGVAGAAANVCRVLHAAGRPDIPVAIGAAGPIGPVPTLRPADFIHGSDGLGETHRPAAPFGPVPEPADELLARVVAERPGELTVVTLGPLSTLGALVQAEPTWAGAVGRLVVMGGTVDGPGNAQPYAEANIAHDPDAAAAVVTASWAAPPTLVGLDVTHCAVFTDAHWEALAAARTPAAAFLAGPLAFYRRFAGTFTAHGACPCHDLLATMVAVHPDLVAGPVLPLAVQTAPGPAWGATIADRRAPFFRRAGAGSQQAAPSGFSPWTVALDVDVERYQASVDRLLRG
jgi:inosine-uridine nucleoside N-ribohydrolase